MKFSWYFITFIGLTFYANILNAQSDGCSSATVLTPSSSCSPTAGTTVGATETIPGCVGDADDDVWYSFVATATSHQIDVVGSAGFDAVVQLFSGSCSTLVSQGCQDNTFSGGTETIYANGLTIGNTYTIRVYDYYSGSPGTFTICVHDAPPQPSNDFCANAIALAVNTSCSYTTGTSLGASQTMTGCAGTADDDVWYSFVATNSEQTITVTPSSSMDPVVQLVDGTCGSFTSLYCEDNGFTNDDEVISAVGLTPGQTYYVRVYDYYSGNGGYDFDICVTGDLSAAPSNDEPCNAIQIPPVTAECSYLNFTTTGATATDPSGSPTPLPTACVGGSGYPAGAIGGYSASSADVWFAITVPSNGNIFINPEPGYGINDAVMALYSGTCGSLTQIACSDDNDYPGSANDLKPYINATGLTPGSTVYLRYWGYGTNQGDFGICVSSPTNDDCANALYICDINGYSASTSAAYTEDRPGTGAGQMYGNGETNTGVFMGNLNTTHTGGPFGYPNGSSPSGYYNVTIDNNSWITFTASATTATLTVSIYDCWVGNYPSGGIQMQVFEGSNCDNFVSVSNFEENSTGFTLTATGLTVGQDYYLVVDGYAGDICSYTITADSGVQFPDITATNNPICSGETTTLSAPAGATSYTWYPGGGATQDTIVAPSVTTTYTCIVEGVCGYKQTLTKTIYVNQLPTLTSSTSGSICSGDNVNMTLVSDIVSSYTWNAQTNYANVSGESTSSQSGSTINDVLTNSTSSTETVVYNVIPTAISSSCVGKTQTVTVDVDPLPTVVASSTSSAVCDGQTVTLSGSGASSYSWNNGVTNGVAFTPSSTTTYTVTGTDANGCQNTDNISVTVNALPSVTAVASSSSVCDGDPVNLTGAGTATSYSWDNGVTNGVAFVPTSTVLYTVIGTDGNGCQNSDAIVVTVNNLPTVVANATSTSICDGDVLTLSGSGAISYSWDNSVTNGVAFTPSVGTTLYNVVGTDGNGCTNSDNISVTVNSLPTVSITASGTTICDGDPVTLSGNGATSYSWNNGVTNGVAFNPSSTNTYTVTGTDANNCQNTDNVTVTVNSLPTVVANATSTGLCDGETVTLTGSGATSYSWDNSVTDGVGFTPSVGTTIYNVTGTDGNGCTNTDNISVTVNSLPTVTISASGTTVCDGDAVTLSGNGATSYSWDNGITNGVAFTPVVGSLTYTVTGTDGNNCENTDQVTVTVNPLDDPSFSYTTGSTYCLTGTDPVATVTGLSGGTFTISGGATINSSTGAIDLDASGVGSYTITYTTSGSCPNDSTFSLTISGQMDASLTVADDTLCEDAASVTISTIDAGGTWTGSGVDNSGNFDPSNAGSGSHEIIYTISGSCGDADTLTMVVNTVPQVSVMGDTNCVGDSAVLVATGNGGIINWYSDVALTNLVASDTNQYSSTVIGINTFYVQEVLNGCPSNIDSANANVFNLTTSFTANPTSGNLPLEVDFTNTSTVVDTLNDQFYWSFGTDDYSNDFEPTYTFNDAGSFTTVLTVTNAEGMCSDTAQITIEVNGEFSIEIPNIFTPNGDDENDIFHINATNVKEVKASIYDRWGLHLYSWEGIKAGWDGRTKAGVLASEGTYFYFIEVVDLFGEVHLFEGPFNLNR